VRYHLTGSEVLKILDYAEALETDLSSGEVKTLCQDLTLLPIKVVVRILGIFDDDFVRQSEFESQKRLKINAEMEFVSPAEPVPLPKMTKDCNTKSNSTPLDRNAKATKSDDAEVPEYLWNKVENLLYP
jgi:hypothetical protein